MNSDAVDDPRSRNALILAVKAAIEATFTETDWKELGYLTDTIEWISRHERLLRSLKWQDDDYGGHVLDAIEKILDQDPANLQKLLQFGGIEDWVRENAPDLYAEFFGISIPAAEAVSDAVEASEGFDIDDYIKRIRGSLESDAALAVGSTKELLEAVFKEVLGLHGASIGDEDMPKLLKRTQVALGLDPRDVDDTVPGANSLRRLLGSLGQIVVAVTELRNLCGTGHGRTRAPGLDPASVRLVVGAGTTLAAYLMERYRSLKD